MFVNRLEKRRKIQEKTTRLVLACRDCNHIRGRLDEFRLINELFLNPDQILYQK